MPIPLIGKLIKGFVGTEGLMDSVNVDITSDEVAESNVRDAVVTLRTQVTSLINSNFNSNRAFIKFNDGITIDRTNIATYEDRNLIYAARNDKGDGNANRPDINLPNDVEIAASGVPYPITFEVTHLGGTIVSATDNIIRYFLDGGQINT